jgi:ribosomal-protein-alanine N-acetyltransferase
MSALMKPRLRRVPMSIRELDAVMAIETSAYSHPWTRGNFIDSIAAGYLAEVLVGDDLGVVGYFIAMSGVGELHLLNITVAPAWQGQGFGSSLMRTVQAHASALGLDSLWLEVRQSNLKARALYRHLGFAEVGLRKGYYPAVNQREDAIVMSLQVPPTMNGAQHGLD